jgi:hypothetical protein
VGAWFGGRARTVACPTNSDPRGSLTPFDLDALPFAPRRVFSITGAPVGTRRGGHAHRSGAQLLVCLQGRIGLWLRTGDEEARAVLEPGGDGVLFGPGV